jgi:hypothetical protein
VISYWLEGSKSRFLLEKKGDLPPEFHALLGTRHLRELGVSLDYVMDNPGGTLQQAIQHRSTQTSPLVSLPSPSMSEVKRGVFLEHFALFGLVFLVVFLLALAFDCGAHSAAPTTHLSWIEPRALLVSLLTLVLAKFVCTWHPPTKPLKPRAKRVVSLSRAPNYSQGPRGWVSSRPTRQPGSPLRNVQSRLPVARENIFLLRCLVWISLLGEKLLANNPR